MDIAAQFGPHWNGLSAWVAAFPRAMVFFMVIPVLQKDVVPGLLRACVIGAICLPLIPLMAISQLSLEGSIAAPTIAVIFKEIVIGLMLGLPIAWIFSAIESAGMLIDTQSGSQVASVINPMTSSESAILGTFMPWFFLAFFVLAGGLSLLIDVLYHSYLLWPIDSVWPVFTGVGLGWWLDQFSRYAGLTLLLAAPVLICTFFIDIGFGFLGKFSPKMQLFILAMPLKNIVAILLMLFYLSALMGRFDGFLRTMKVNALGALGVLQ
ncbi:type III secretion system export apparatus subunit SctT [Glaciimonas sp. GG7]